MVVAQGIAGVAKDLTKTASKSAIKATSRQGAGQLFRWVAWFTGSKNAMKGAGFFVGGLLLQVVGFRAALWLMAAMLARRAARRRAAAAAHAWARRSRRRRFRELFAKTRAINLMAAARIFMFGSRDVWFVVGLPVFLYGYGWQYMQVAGFVATWTIGYGRVQAIAPSVVTPQRATACRAKCRRRALWGGVLTAIPVVLALLLNAPGVARPDLVWSLGLADLRLRLRRDLVAAFLSDPRLRGIRKGGRGCRLLLRGQCRRAAARSSCCRASSPRRRPGRLPVGLDGHARYLPGDHLAAARGGGSAAGCGTKRFTG